MKLDPIYYREKTVDHYGKRGMRLHVIGNENKQDKIAVFALLEAIILGMKKYLPEFDKVTLLSDNAGCYQNKLLMLLIPLLSYAHGIQISRFMHTETQDGKSVLDAHFARSMQVITSLCKEGRVHQIQLA
jgi:hypothetical protein